MLVLLVAIVVVLLAVLAVLLTLLFRRAYVEIDGVKVVIVREVDRDAVKVLEVDFGCSLVLFVLVLDDVEGDRCRVYIAGLR